MTADTLPDEVNFVFFVEELPEDGLHRVAIAVEGMDATIPTAMIALDTGDVHRLCDKLNRRLGHDRVYWTAFAAHCWRTGSSGNGSGD